MITDLHRHIIAGINVRVVFPDGSIVYLAGTPVDEGAVDMAGVSLAPVSLWNYTLSGEFFGVRNMRNPEAVLCLWGDERVGSVSVEVAKVTGDAIEVLYAGTLMVRIPAGARTLGYDYFTITL